MLFDQLCPVLPLQGLCPSRLPLPAEVPVPVCTPTEEEQLPSTLSEDDLRLSDEVDDEPRVGKLSYALLEGGFHFSEEDNQHERCVTAVN